MPHAPSARRAAALSLVPLFALAAAPARALPPGSPAQDSFVNWESPHVHPLERTLDGARLLAVNTPDGRLEVFDAAAPTLVPLHSIPVGLDPVSVRSRTAVEAWVVNHVSDSVSVVDLATGRVRATLATADEPWDVVFGGSPERAFVSCGTEGVLLVFDPANLSAPPLEVPLDVEDPRALAVSADGSEVYVAVFASGNGSTILGGGAVANLDFPPNVVSSPLGPYGGQNPPPNAGNAFEPPIDPNLPPPPAVGLIVKQDASGHWMDDNGGDWTDLVSGPNAPESGRPVGWELPDRDLVIVDANTLSVRYASRAMNLCMALAVHPASGEVTIVGTDATNEVRFEPNLQGRFLRVEFARIDPVAAAVTAVVDLNPHLDYTVPTIPQAERDRSLGDPRGIVWSADGTRGYVAGMGSNDVVPIDASGARAGAPETIEVGEGPTGLALDEATGRLFVLDKFESAISVVDLAAGVEVERVPFYTPEPPAIRDGRKHLYSTHDTSGLGHISCASCHVDGRMDRLAWDLGDPSGEMKPFEGNCLDQGCQDWHPMKGPMLTQTLIDIIGHEPLHWRGDRRGLEEFNGAFQSLQGDDAQLTPAEMQEFEDFLATLTFPPNPYRELDNSLPTALPLPGHFTTGRFAPAGQPLPPGDAVRGLALYRPPNLLDGGAVACVTCHTLPTGMGADAQFQITTQSWVPIPPGPDGEHHLAMVSVDGSTNVTMKVAHLRNLYRRTGFNATQVSNRAGFGYLHDGSVDSIERFVSEPVFQVQSDQDVADLVAFMLAFSGSDLPEGSPNSLLEPPGPPTQDTHAAVGTQTTLVDLSVADTAQISLLDALEGLADAGAIDFTAKGIQGGLARGYVYLGGGQWQSDRLAETLTSDALRAGAAPGEELTFTAVPSRTGRRIGVDRDEDGFLDRDELDAGSDPADPGSTPGSGPGTPYCFGDGSGVPCPCGNEAAAPSGCANSSGLGATLAAAGTAVVGADTVMFTGSGLLPNQPALLFQGDNAIAGGLGVPFGDGLRCAGGGVVRLGVLVPDPAGAVSYPGGGDPPVSVKGGVAPGDVKRYQLWYRDPTGGPCASTFNLSNGYEIAWQ